MDADAYRRLRAEARRHARRAVDADDLVQDALLIALELGRSDGEFVEVLRGIDPGESYVADSSFLLKADIEKSGASHDH